MKKIFLIILILLMASPIWAATYYGGAASKNLNADDLWFDAVDGSCSGTAGHGVTWATASANGNKLIANGCTITLPNTSNQTLPSSGTVTLSTKTDGASNVVDGGTFAYTTSATYSLILQANIETGQTSSSLTLTGTANTNPAFTIGSSGTPVTIVGGTANAIRGVADSHTSGTVVAYATVTGGSSGSTSRGWHYAATSGNVNIIGSCVGNVSNGCWTDAAGTITVQNCEGSTSTAGAAGCQGTGGYITMTGNDIGTVKSVGASGLIKYNPAAANNYIQRTYDGLNFYYFGAIDKTVVQTGTTCIDKEDGATVGSLSAGGGGAWSF